MNGLDAVVERVRELVDEGETGLAYALARNLSRRLEVVSDRSLVPEVLRTFVASTDDATLLAVLNVLSVRARTGDRHFRRGAMELALNAELLRDSLDYERLEEVYGAAHAAELREVVPLFFHSKYKPNVTLDEAAPENQFFEAPLGNRVAAARRSTDRDTLDRLMRDRNPRVIAKLLDNPRVVERDVIGIAARRPTNPDILSLLATHRRWSPRYRVRKALACNPYCPHPVASRLMATLLLQDLHFISGSSVLPPHVQDEARRLIREAGISRGQLERPQVWVLDEDPT